MNDTVSGERGCGSNGTKTNVLAQKPDCESILPQFDDWIMTVKIDLNSDPKTIPVCSLNINVCSRQALDYRLSHRQSNTLSAHATTLVWPRCLAPNS